MVEVEVEVVAGFAVPVVLAPMAVLGLRHSFAVFLSEGDDLFGHKHVSRGEALSLGSTLALCNVGIFLLTWIAWFTCDCFDVSMDLRTAFALGGISAALLATLLVLHITLALRGWLLTVVGLLAFVGGNLPLFLVVPLLMFVL